MASMLPSDSSHHGIVENSPYRFTQDRHDEVGGLGASWYFNRREIEENSPSMRDGIDLKKEAYIRKSYCTYLQDLGMRLKVPQVTIATAIVFCHRFFLRQSHAKNDRRTIATVCMFLAGKVEETPRPLKDVILVSYEIIHKKDPAAVQRIKQREVYEQQKELILLGERVVLATLGFDLNVHHPYKPLVEAIKKFKVAQNALAQVAWNFVNDGLRTSLCLQFKPHHIAAGAIFLAAKFLKVKLPSDGEKVWWQEFDVTPRQLEEVSNQMLELYEQNRAAEPSQGNETEGSSASVANQRIPVKAPGIPEELPTHGYHQVPKQSSMQHSTPTGAPIHYGYEQSHPDKYNGNRRMLQNDDDDFGGNKARGGPSESRFEAGARDSWHHDQKILQGNLNTRSGYESEHPIEEQKSLPMYGSPNETRGGTVNGDEGPNVSSSMMDAIKKIDKDKVKAALEKRRKSKGDTARKVDAMDDDDFIERELEHGVELAAEDEKTKQERRQNWSHIMHREDPHSSDRMAGNGYLGKLKVPDISEEGELSMDSQDHRSPEVGARKRRDGFEYDYDSHQYHHALKHREGHDDARAAGRYERGERDHKRPRSESQGL